MSFYHAREVNLLIDGKNIFCNNLSLSQQADLSQPFLADDQVSTRNIANSPKKNQLNLTYYLTGKCPLKDYIFTDRTFPLAGSVNGVSFNMGYLESYQLSSRPNEPISISAQILIADEVSGNFTASVPLSPPDNLSVWNYNDSSFSDNTLNIVGYDWNFTNTIEPIYLQKDSNLSIINPDSIFIGEKKISANIVSDSENLVLGFAGAPFNIDFTCRHPSQNITEVYSVSGFINKKDFSVSDNNVSQSTYSITQSHLNEEPKIALVDTSTYPTNNYIRILSPNLSNGYFSTNNNYSLVEDVSLGDRDLKFNAVRGASFDTITGYIPNDAINGNLQVSTTKGLIIYPSRVTLNFPAIGISGFSPITGAPHSLVLITGTNFYRISDVKFNNLSSNFTIIDNTGSIHKISAFVPDNATIGKIAVYSSMRGVSGFSTGNFFPQMSISQFTPTGTWSGICVISGANFTGITDVYFNKIKSPSFSVVTNEQIIARTPITGAGFAKGYLTLSGIQGMSTNSKTIYQPILKITGISLLSGRPENDIAISGIFDSGYLYFESGGYRVSFGKEYSVFLRSGGVSDFVLTGYVPINSFVSEKPAMIEPDGATRYPSFTGSFIQVAKPIVNLLNGTTADFNTVMYKRQDIVLKGQNLKYFFGVPYYLIISGLPNYDANGVLISNNVINTYSNIDPSDDGTSLTVKDIRMTGNPFLERMYGKVGVVNYAGTGWFPGRIHFANDAVGLYQTPTVAQNSEEVYWWTRDANNGFVLPRTIFTAQGALTNSNIASFTNRFGTLYSNAAIVSTSGYVDFTFNQVVDFGGIWVSQPSTMPANDRSPWAAGGGKNMYYENGMVTYSLAQTGTLECRDLSLNRVFLTGLNFSINNSRNLSKGLSNNQLVTGVKKIRIYRTDGDVFLGWQFIRFFG